MTMTDFSLITVFEDLEQCQTGVVVERLQYEVIKDDEVIFSMRLMTLRRFRQVC